VRNQNGSEAAVQATTYAIAVLIISCPCAIGLAVPMVIVIAGGVAADRGVIFRTAETLETARKVTHVVFDKTGTLTTGKLTVSDAVYFGDEQAERISSLALGLVADIKHPVSQAVTKHLKDSGVLAEKLTNVKASPGKGVHGQCGSTILRAGNPHWLGMDSDPSIANYLSSASTLLCITVGGMLGAVFILQDSVRLEAADVMQRLKRAGISISIVSGDNTSAVDSVALILGISPSHALARQDPAAKAAYITTLRKQGATVMFVGDGTNDAVALAAAHIGLHIGDDAHGGGLSSSTSDVARGAADAVLLRPDLRGVCVLIELSRAAFRRVTFNFAWSFVYNLFAVLLAAGAFVHARVPPAYAGLGELVSVLPVIAAAVQLRWARVSGGIKGE
jgi:Cu2+-exporting ATPase